MSATMILTLFLTLVMFITLFIGIWMLVEFSKIEFTDESKQSTEHKIIEILLGVQIGIASLLLVIILTTLILNQRKKGEQQLQQPQQENPTGFRYGWVLVGLMLSTMVIAVLNSIIFFSFIGLTVTDKSSQAFKNFSTFSFMAPSLYFTASVLIGVIWYFMRRLSKCEQRAGMSIDERQKYLQQQLSEEDAKRKQEKAKIDKIYNDRKAQLENLYKFSPLPIPNATLPSPIEEEQPPLPQRPQAQSPRPFKAPPSKPININNPQTSVSRGSSLSSEYSSPILSKIPLALSSTPSSLPPLISQEEANES